MVIGVVEKQWIHHGFNRRLTTRTCILLSICKFEVAVAAHDLVFFLGCYRPATLPAMDESREGKSVIKLRAGISIAA
jgi:hypothetical protein